MHHTFISAQALTPKLNLSALSALISRLMIFSINDHAIVSFLSWQTPTQSSSSLLCHI